MEVKICNKCKRELPRNTDYYFKKKDNNDGFTNRCKECQGYNFTDKLTKIPKEGYRFCIKCDRELPSTYIYFPMDNMCKDGIRNVCRECGKDGHFMDDDYIAKRVWSNEENELFAERFPHYTYEELINNFYPNETKKGIDDRAYRLGLTNTKTKDTTKRGYKIAGQKKSGENHPFYGKPKSEETKKKISLANKEYYKIHPHPSTGRKMSQETKQKISQHRIKNKIWVGIDNPRHKDPLFGERNGRWEGGVKEIYQELRDSLQSWKQDSMQECQYKCIITGDDFDNIHHLVPFRKIVDEVFEVLKMPIYKTTGEYTKEQKSLIVDKLQELHVFYGLGVCLRKDIHKLFHDLYGYTENTPEQFDEFKTRYRFGDFNYILN